MSSATVKVQPEQHGAVGDPGLGVPGVWGHVPPQDPTFTGRGGLLAEVRDCLSAGRGRQGVLPVVVCGPLGTGKTAVAVEYVHRHAHDYDLVWWIPAHDQAGARAALTELAHRLGVAATEPDPVAVVLDGLRRGQAGVGRWLLVFDDAPGPETVRPFLPATGCGDVLVTSRSPAWGAVAHPVRVDVLPRPDSIQLLHHRAPFLTREDGGDLAEALGDLPVALAQAAAWLAVTGMPVRDYLQALVQRPADILATAAATGYPVPVTEAWTEALTEVQARNPSAHQLLRVCAFYAPGPIPHGVITGADPEVVSAAGLDAGLGDVLGVHRAIRDLVVAGLASLERRTGTLDFHRLLQLIVRHGHPGEGDTVAVRVAAYRLLADDDPRDPESSHQWPRYQALSAHAEAADVVVSGDARVRELVLNLIRAQLTQGQHQRASELAGRAVDSWSPAPAATGTAIRCAHLSARQLLARSLFAQGQYTQARELNQTTYQQWSTIVGDGGENAVLARLALAGDSAAYGDFGAARRLSEEIHRNVRALHGPDAVITVAAAVGHAVALRLTGDHAGARALDEDAHQRCLQLFGPDHPRTHGAWLAVLLDRRAAGDTSVRVEHEALVEQIRSQYGEDSPVTWWHACHLAATCRADGDHPAALTLSVLAHEHLGRHYGQDHPRATMAALGHAVDLRRDGQLAAARALGEHGFDRHRNTLGEHHPHTHLASVNLAVTLRVLGEADSARHLDQRSLEQLRVQLGPDHPDAIATAVNLASDHASAGDHDTAFRLTQEAQERARRVLGDHHPITLAADTNHVADLRALGRSDDADRAHTDTVARHLQQLGLAHPATTAASRGLRADLDLDPLPLAPR